MSEYTPDNWVIIKINNKDKPLYKVLAGWSGGYLDGDSWRMNSGITEVKVIGDYIEFWGYTGSCYTCHKNAYGLRMNNAGVWKQLQEKFGDMVELLPDNTDWSTL